MKVRQYEQGRVTPDSVNQQKISGFVSDGGASALGGALQNVSKQFQQAQVEVDQTHAEEARLNFDRDITTILHDADNGYFNTSGKTAYEKQEETRKAIEIARKNHAKSLSPEQTKMFDSVANRMVESNYKAIMTHGSRGRKTWDIATQEAVVENSVEKASLNFENDEEIAVQLATLRNSVKISSDQQGIGPEATNERLQTMTSKFYSSIIGKAIEGNTGRAKDLFKRVSKYLEPDDKSKVERVLKATVNKESAMSTVDEWTAKGYSTTQAMSEAQKIKDPVLREATENRFLKQQRLIKSEETRVQNEAAEMVYDAYSNGIEPDVKAIEKMGGKARIAFNNIQRQDRERQRITLEREETRVQSEAADSVYKSYSSGVEPDSKAIEKMGGKARITFNNIQHQDRERKRIELEREEKAAIKEQYQYGAINAFNGMKWEDIKGSLAGLPIEERNKIKNLTVSYSNYEKAIQENDSAAIKKTQSEWFEQLKLGMETQGLTYDDIVLHEGGAIGSKLNADQIEYLKKRSLQIQKPEIDVQEEYKKIQRSNIEWKTRIALLNVAQDDPQRAMTDFLAVADRFDPTRRIAFQKQLQGFIKDPKSKDQISTSLTISQRVNNITGDSKGKRNFKKAFELMEKWDTYQAGIQAEHSRKPNKAETDLFFKEAVKEVIQEKDWWPDSKVPAYKTDSFNLDVLQKRQGDAKKTGHKEVRYTDYTKSGGSRSWRNNNSGNIEYGAFAIRNGAIGTDGRFAIFPDKETGDNAKIALLKTSRYKNKTIQGAISIYAPQFENNTAKYARDIASAAGVSVRTKLSSLDESQFKKLVDAMTKIEGWKEGDLL